MSYQLTPVRMATPKETKITSVVMDVEEKKNLPADKIYAAPCLLQYYSQQLNNINHLSGHPMMS